MRHVELETGQNLGMVAEVGRLPPLSAGHPGLQGEPLS